jgi:glycosyltransferase involved in cell wall biosynthesis
MKASIIISTYNEEKTIENVVKSCCKFNKGSEIIVVDDGSTDNTERILYDLQRKFNFIYEKLPENKGKSWAMVRGVEIASNDIILFFDADVSNIKQEHFDSLLSPLYNKEVDMVLGQPSETLINYKVNPFRSLTGERALYKKDIIPILNDIREIKFGVETFINLYYQSKGKTIKYVLLNGLVHPTKYEKTTSIKATKEFINEGKEIALTLLKNNELIKQRIELLFDTKKANSIDKINKVQHEINEKLKKLKNQLDKFI